MTEPVSTTIATYFSIAKVWGIVSGVCGSLIPVLALADRTHVTLIKGCFMAITGSSFAIFVGPWLCEKLGINFLEGIAAMSWFMGATGVYIIRAVLKWLDEKAVDAIDKFVNKNIGGPTPPANSSNGNGTTININTTPTNSDNVTRPTPPSNLPH